VQARRDLQHILATRLASQLSGWRSVALVLLEVQAQPLSIEWTPE